MRKYGKIVNVKSIEWMPNPVFYEGRWISNPPKSVRDALGWKPVFDTPYPRILRKGWHFVKDGWHDRGNVIVTRWKPVKDEQPAPRRWTRLSLKTALAQAELFP